MLHLTGNSQANQLAFQLERAGVGHGMTAEGVLATGLRVDRQGTLYFCEMRIETIAHLNGVPDGSPIPKAAILAQNNKPEPEPGYYRGRFDVTNINGCVTIDNLVLEEAAF